MNHSKTMKNAFYEIENEFPYDCDVSSLNVWKLPKKQKNKILCAYSSKNMTNGIRSLQLFTTV